MGHGIVAAVGGCVAEDGPADAEEDEGNGESGGGSDTPLAIPVCVTQSLCNLLDTGYTEDSCRDPRKTRHQRDHYGVRSP